MPDKTLAERLPSLLPAYDDSTDFAAWLDAHQVEVDRHDADLETVKKSLQIAYATGDDLEEIGGDFGVLGRRRGRDDDTYRQYLMSLVQAYRGRGTPPGVRKAIAAGVLIDESDVELIEDFDANHYEVRLHDWTAHRTGAVRDLASLSDPSVIQRREPIHYQLPTATVTIDAAPTIVDGGVTTETASVRVTSTGTTSLTTSTRGLSASELEPLSQGGTWNLQ